MPDSAKAATLTPAQRETLWAIYSGREPKASGRGRRHQTLQALYSKGLIDANDNLTALGNARARVIR